MPPSPLITTLRENHENTVIPIVTVCLQAEASERHRASWPVFRAIRLHARHWMGKTSELFIRADRNGDGKLTGKEILAVMDADGDGEVSAEEFEAAFAGKRRAA